MKNFVKRIIFSLADKLVELSNQKKREDKYKQFGFPISVNFDQVSFEGNKSTNSFTVLHLITENNKVIINKDFFIIDG